MRQTNNGWSLFKVKNKDNKWNLFEVDNNHEEICGIYSNSATRKPHKWRFLSFWCYSCHLDAVFSFVRSASSYGQNLSCLFQKIFRCLRHPRELFWSAYFCSQSECRRTRFSVRIFSYYVFSSEHADHINPVFLRFLTFPA